MTKKSILNINKMLVKSNWKDRKEKGIRNYIKNKIKEIKEME